MSPRPMAPRAVRIREDGALEIELTRGKVAIVDAIDESIATRRWSANRAGRNSCKFYAARHEGRGGGRGVTLLMHRAILGLTDPRIEVDHINGDGLDNRRANLRIATRSGNMRNTGRHLNNSSGFKGVHRLTGRSKWCARITVESGRRLYIGYYESAEEAARAYDREARRFHGEFARVNFPEVA